MKMLKLFKNQSGVTLIESMVAISILSVISLTVATLLKDAGEGVKTNEAKSEITGLKNILLSNFTDTLACTNTFGPYISQPNLTAATGSGLVTIPLIKNKINDTTYSTATTTVRPLTITGMYLTNYVALAGTADLLVKTTFQKSSTKVVKLKDIRVPINMNITGPVTAPVLSGCSTMAVGDGWTFAGNAGTVDGTDYIGTSDNIPLNFKVNAQRAGRIDSVGVTTFGYQAGNSPSYLGHMMTAFGYKAASGASSGQNSAFGFQALMTGSANRNTAIGWGALSLGVTGIDNTAVGVSALSNNQGIENTGLGHGALAANTTGSQNTAVGARVMPYTTSGNNNTAFGYNIMYGSSGYAGSGNTAVGSGIM
jgi:prepilin-type N-terminal cleavage/methylation domain-containing protein